MPTDPNELRARLSLPRPEDSPPPEAANFFHFAFAGPDVQMMVGYVDPRNIHALTVEKTTQEITPRISHRFAISPTGFALLRKQLEEIGPSFDVMVQTAQQQMAAQPVQTAQQQVAAQPKGQSGGTP